MPKQAHFDDVFGNSTLPLKQIDKERWAGAYRFTTETAYDAWVSNCLFFYISSTSRGAAICCSAASNSSGVQRLFIEETIFTECKTMSSYAGGIYFYNTNNGECVIFRTCCFNCSSMFSDHSWGQFACIETKFRATTSKNEVNETTITGIMKEESTITHYALILEYSNIICSSVNITNNECYHCPALLCYPTNNTDVCTCCIIYTSIVNNSANGSYGCILLSNLYATQLISTSNIINNKQSTDDHATIIVNTNLFINESCIIGNNECKQIFSISNSLSNIKITNCTLDSDILTSSRYSGELTIISSKEFSFINALSHIVTGRCNSTFDSYGTLTVAVNIQKNGSRNCPVITPYCKCMKQYNIDLLQWY